MGPPELSEVPVLKTADNLVLPLDAYVLSGDERVVVNRAEAALAEDCLRRFGISEKLPNFSSAQGPSEGRYARRYGLLDMALATANGYRPAKEEASTESDIQQRPTLSAEAVTVYTGRGPSHVNGKVVPQGGCQGEAREKLDDGPSRARAGSLVELLDKQANDSAEDDKRTRDAMLRWGECMAKAGFHYKDVWGPNGDPAWRETTEPSSEEISIARADVACKHEVNLVGVWHAVEVAYQNQAIKQNREKLDAERMRLTGTVELARDVLKERHPER